MTIEDQTNLAERCVYIIDDDPDVRGALDSLFRSAGLRSVQFDSTEAFLAAGPPTGPACLVLDIRLRGEDGLEFQERLTRSGVNIPTVLMTGHGDIPMTVRGMKAGAVDFLPKPFSDDAMLSAVAAAFERDRSLRAEREETARIAARYERLSPREREVMALVVAGLMNKQVAGQLGLSEVTVKIHRGAVMRKMAAQSLADLVRMAEMLGVRDTRVSRHSTSA
jgi:FixJ family two-component response regulator